MNFESSNLKNTLRLKQITVDQKATTNKPGKPASHTREECKRKPYQHSQQLDETGWDLNLGLPWVSFL